MAIKAESSGLKNEPVYHRKPLSYWILGESHVSADYSVPDLGDEGRNAVRDAGTNAIFFLLRWITSPRTSLAFRELGSNAVPAIPELLRLITNPPISSMPNSRTSPEAVQVSATTALWQIGPEALPALCIVVTNKSAGEGRNTALTAIVLMGDSAEPAVPALLCCLKDENSKIAGLALLGLRRTGSTDPRVFAAASSFLVNPDSKLRSEALEIVARFHNQALPSLTRALSDEDTDVRTTALTLLVETAPNVLTNTAVLAVAAQAMYSTGQRQKWGAQLLRAAGQQSQGAAPDLLVRFPGGWDLVFQEATNALRRLAPHLLR